MFPGWPSSARCWLERQALWGRFSRTITRRCSGSGAITNCLLTANGSSVVADRPEGRQTHYRARPAALKALVDWTGEMTGFWEARIDALEDLLKRMDQ